jgi:hypothetical protein
VNDLAASEQAAANTPTLTMLTAMKPVRTLISDAVWRFNRTHVTAVCAVLRPRCFLTARWFAAAGRSFLTPGGRAPAGPPHESALTECHSLRRRHHRMKHTSECV